MTALVKLSAKQVEFLKACADSRCASLGVGSSTIRRLRMFDLITKDWRTEFSTYAITDAGRAWLKENGK